ncbi:hypothetical protein [Bailinhaonella thermotolerans]|uniref:Lipoprotein n=1 Tax=Bailinhaonella thermotolerans TaxID=1070861 RepID=A0A3A4AQU1_9ACTN|nr:hypothetical protein [Bailinhaonella thermotolerans]RJL31461.1 hypothetical protein D5H75_19530 [Bailinhaonella thermotolerans]
MRTTRKRAGRLGALAAVPLAFTLALGGCGGGGGEGGDVPSAGGSGGKPAAAAPTPTQDQHDLGLKYAQCMRENGVELPDPEPGKPFTMRFDGSVPREKVQKAMDACKRFAPFKEGAAKDPKRADAMRAMSQCMRDNGVEKFPDPTDAGGIQIGPEVGDDPDFQEAQKKCQRDFPAPGAS